MAIKLVKIIETCMGCPSQWDAWDVDGKYYYLRYRFGRASIEGFSDPEFWEQAEPGGPYPPTHYENYWTFGDKLDGIMELEEFARQGSLDISEAEIIRYGL